MFQALKGKIDGETINQLRESVVKSKILKVETTGRDGYNCINSIRPLIVLIGRIVVRMIHVGRQTLLVGGETV